MEQSAISDVSGRRAVDERLMALDRILKSKAFSNCDTMRNILEFVVKRSIAGHVDQIKEYTIATEVLGRSGDFNPKGDNIVRVQVHRLRKKLDEYYDREGLYDPVRIFIPRGHYYPEYLAFPSIKQASGDHRSFNERPSVDGNSFGEQDPGDGGIIRAAHSMTPGGDVPRFFGSLSWQRIALGLLILNLGLSGYLLSRSVPNTNPAKGQSQLSKSFVPLWQPFVLTNQPPLIVYSNALFLMSEQGDLYRYYADTSHSFAMGAEVPGLAGLERRGPVPARLGPLYYFDSYTGIGEVIATGKIAQLLSRNGQDVSVKRSRITSYEDVRNRNVIFLGATLEDSMLGRLPVESDLVFEEPTGDEFVGKLLIRDRHPPDGKPSAYVFARNERTKALESEYALISLLPGVTPNQHILILAGLSTLGTQAAAEFATSEESLITLEKIRSASQDKTPLSPYFQALLEVEIRDGIAVKINCLLVRELHQ